ncbi:MAG: hypothetical protein QNJ45_02990 [Ardenticatenaceae bacterium]|nr:hypothetical protein [Ardenticatenaceae bacterium]
MSDPVFDQEPNRPPSPSDDAALWADLQSLLLAQERARVHELEELVESLQEEIDHLQKQLGVQRELVVPTVTNSLSRIANDAVEQDRRGMAGALGPIIGEATRIQIRDSKDEMVEALYPIIGDSVVRAVTERFREFQRQIDARIRPRGGVLDNVALRLRGVNPSDVALRDALPFEITQLFLIQHDTGFVLEHFALDSSQAADSDLISGMLTAIRSFMEDSFDPTHESDEDLDSIYHGDANVILQSGSVVYAAAVVNGTEPAGFRAALRGLLTDLNLEYRDDFEAYDGDPETLPPLEHHLETWVEEIEAGLSEKSPSTDSSKKVLTRLAVALMVILVLLCGFMSWFVWRLMPTALGLTEPPPTVVATVVVTATPTATLPPTATITPSVTPSPTPTVTPSATPTTTPTATRTPTVTPQPTGSPFSRINGPVWSRVVPDLDEPPWIALIEGTEVDVLIVQGEWTQIRWNDPIVGEVEGWVPNGWVDLSPSDTIGSDADS